MYANNIIVGGAHVLGDVNNIGVALCDEAQIRRDRFLNCLRHEGMNQRYFDIEDPHKGTYEWMFPDTSHTSSTDDCDFASSGIPNCSFSNWLIHGNGIFCIEGKAGSGKSTLVKFLISHPRTKELLAKWASPATILNYFFCLSDSVQRCTLKAALASMLYQLILQNPEVLDSLLVHMPRLTMVARYEEWSPKDLITAFRHAVSICSGSLLLLMDGLDELAVSRNEDLCRFFDLFDMLRTGCRVKFCLSSRPLGYLKNRPGVSDKLSLHEFTKCDIHRFCLDRLNKEKVNLLQAIPSEAELKLLARDIASVAEGVFLWAVTIIRSLSIGLFNLDSFETLQNRLQELPKEMEQLYKEMCRRQNLMSSIYKPQASRILAYARMFPMSIFELAVTLDPSLQERYLSSLEPVGAPEMIRICEEIRQNLSKSCLGLLEVHEKLRLSSNEELELRLDHRTAIAREVGEACVERFLTRSLRLGPEELVLYDHLFVSFSHRCARDFLLDTLEGQKVIGIPLINTDSFAYASLAVALAAMIESIRQIELSQFQKLLSGNWDESRTRLVNRHVQSFVNRLYGVTLSHNWYFYIGSYSSREPKQKRVSAPDCANAMIEMKTLHLQRCLADSDNVRASSYYRASLLFALKLRLMPGEFSCATVAELEDEMNMLDWLFAGSIDLLTPQACYCLPSPEYSTFDGPIILMIDPVALLVTLLATAHLMMQSIDCISDIQQEKTITIDWDMSSPRGLADTLRQSDRTGNCVVAASGPEWRIQSFCEFLEQALLSGDYIVLEIPRSECHVLCGLSLAAFWKQFRAAWYVISIERRTIPCN